MVARLAPVSSSSSALAWQYTVMMECDRLDSTFSSWLPLRLCCMPLLITCAAPIASALPLYKL